MRGGPASAVVASARAAEPGGPRCPAGPCGWCATAIRRRRTRWSPTRGRSRSGTATAPESVSSPRSGASRARGRGRRPPSSPRPLNSRRAHRSSVRERERRRPCRRRPRCRPSPKRPWTRSRPRGSGRRPPRPPGPGPGPASFRRRSAGGRASRSAPGATRRRPSASCSISATAGPLRWPANSSPTASWAWETTVPRRGCWALRPGRDRTPRRVSRSRPRWRSVTPGGGRGCAHSWVRSGSDGSRNTEPVKGCPRISAKNNRMADNHTGIRTVPGTEQPETVTSSRI